MEIEEIRLEVLKIMVPTCTKFDITKGELIEKCRLIEQYICEKPIEPEPLSEPEKPKGTPRKKVEV